MNKSLLTTRIVRAFLLAAAICLLGYAVLQSKPLSGAAVPMTAVVPATAPKSVVEPKPAVYSKAHPAPSVPSVATSPAASPTPVEAPPTFDPEDPTTPEGQALLAHMQGVTISDEATAQAQKTALEDERTSEVDTQELVNKEDYDSAVNEAGMNMGGGFGSANSGEATYLNNLKQLESDAVDAINSKYQSLEAQVDADTQQEIGQAREEYVSQLQAQFIIDNHLE